MTVGAAGVQINIAADQFINKALLSYLKKKEIHLAIGTVFPSSIFSSTFDFYLDSKN